MRRTPESLRCVGMNMRANRFSNTSLQRGVLAMNHRCNRFSGLLLTFKTAEAVTNMYLHNLHLAKAGC